MKHEDWNTWQCLCCHDFRAISKVFSSRRSEDGEATILRPGCLKKSSSQCPMPIGLHHDRIWQNMSPWKEKSSRNSCSCLTGNKIPCNRVTWVTSLWKNNNWPTNIEIHIFSMFILLEMAMLGGRQDTSQPNQWYHSLSWDRVLLAWVLHSAQHT